MKYIKENWKFLVFILVIGIIASYFTVLYTMNSVPEDQINLAIEQVGSKEAVIAISTLQLIVYVIILGILGVILSNKVGLWKKITFDKKKLLITCIIATIAGLIIIFADLLIFSNFNEIIKQSFNEKPTIETIIMAFTYGGVVEEVMMRLFLMSFFAWIISKIFCRKKKEIPVWVFVIANILSALLFAAGHLPSTLQAFGYLDAILLIRCFLLNGGFGLAFGWLYRKYGITYSMLAHFGAHLVSKLIWLIFI